MHRALDVLDAQDLILDRNTLFIVTGLGIAGSFGGSAVANRLPQKTLKKGFGVFLIIMGGYILIRSGQEAIGL